MPSNNAAYMRDYRRRRKLAGGSVKGTPYSRWEQVHMAAAPQTRSWRERINLALLILRGKR